VLVDLCEGINAAHKQACNAHANDVIERKKFVDRKCSNCGRSHQINKCSLKNKNR
jgi:hypothetical protein